MLLTIINWMVVCTTLTLRITQVCVFFSFIHTGRRLCHMSQTIGLCYVAGRRPCYGGLSSPSTSLFVEPQRRSSHAVFHGRSSLGPRSSILNTVDNIEERHLFREQQLLIEPHLSPLVRSNQLNDLTRWSIWCDLCPPSDVHAAEGCQRHISIG
jgi:hypothetical protein